MYVKVLVMSLDCSEIIQDRLWVGGFVRPEEVRILKRMGVATSLSLQSNRDLADCNISQKQLLKAYALEEIELRRVPIPDFDRQALAVALPQAVEELEKVLVPDQAKAYVHCTAGINRSPTLAAAYLIKMSGLSAREAYDYVISRRHCSPYLATLEDYETSLKSAQPG